MAQTMDIAATYQRGFELRCNGCYSEAKTEFEKVLAVDAGHADSLWQLGLIQGFEGDFEGSLDTLRGIVAKHPDHLHARYDLAMTAMMLGEVDEACGQFRYILSVNPDHEKAKQQIQYCP